MTPTTEPFGDFEETAVSIAGQDLSLGAVLTLPAGSSRCPAMLLTGGSMSNLRDGQLDEADYSGPPRLALRLLAHRLAAWGWASLRWDRVGHGESRVHAGNSPAVGDHVRGLEAAFQFLAQHPRVDASRVVIAGESAGAYYACLAASEGTEPAAYALLGALGSTYEELFRFNYTRTAEYAGRSPEHREWVERVAPRALALGLHWEEMFERALAGEERYLLRYGERSWELHLPFIREQIEKPPLPLFGHLRKPVLVLQGELDMNVPSWDGARIRDRLRAAGNADVILRMIPGADHNFQKAPENPEKRLRERISLDCLARPYADAFYDALFDWLRDTLESKGAKP